MNERSVFDARAWLIWIAAAAILAMAARNPLYSLILLLASRLVDMTWTVRRPPGRLPFWRAAALILVLSAAYQALFVHMGMITLFDLPDDWPLIGGPVTMEAVVYGLTNGLVLVTLLSVFITLNNVVPASDVLRLMPAALYDLGVVVLIALTYVPETTHHLRRIREAQAIRGHQSRGLRDWRPIVIPLLIGGLERSMNVAEAMVARGYGATADIRPDRTAQLSLVMGLVLSLGGWLLAVWQGWVGWLILAAGLVIIATVFWRGRRRSPRTTYRPHAWSGFDNYLALVALWPVLLVLLPWPLIDHSTLAYSPFPRFVWPTFDVWLGLAMGSLALPAIWPSRSRLISLDGGDQHD
jgi:energy-coupling factor transport system permease protein